MSQLGQIITRVGMMGVLALASCTHVPAVTTPVNKDADLIKGPPIVDIVTPFDQALLCLRGRIQPKITFAVGQVLDNTGKEQVADGGNGKFVTQGAGEMVQSALFRAGVTVLNRRDPNISIVESNWGIRDIHRQLPANFYISGSINSLDFIPGGGASLTVAGIGPRYDQSRILIGLDMTMTDAFTGRIVASVPLQKQIFTSEIGASAGRFFGPTLISLDLGGMQREAIHFTLRQMLSLATFELLTQLMDQKSFQSCRERISGLDGMVKNIGSGEPKAVRPTGGSRLEEAEAESRMPLPAQQLSQSPGSAAQPLGAGMAGAGANVPLAANQNMPTPQPSASGASAPPMTAETRKKLQLAGLVAFIRKSATKAIDAASRADGAANVAEAKRFAAEAMQQMAISIQGLREAAAMGLTGQEGDEVALLVEQAMTAAQNAQDAAIQAEHGQPDKASTTGSVRKRNIDKKEFDQRFGQGK